jgi:hypothetical protein
VCLLLLEHRFLFDGVNIVAFPHISFFSEQNVAPGSLPKLLTFCSSQKPIPNSTRRGDSHCHQLYAHSPVPAVSKAKRHQFNKHPCLLQKVPASDGAHSRYPRPNCKTSSMRTESFSKCSTFRRRSSVSNKEADDGCASKTENQPLVAWL